MYTIDQLDTYMKEQCKDSKDMQAAWNCLSTPVKKSDPLYPNRFTHWNCGAVNASLMMALSYINLLGQPIFRTDAIALAAKAAGVDMKEAEKKAAPFAEKHLVTLVKNPTLTPAALLLFHLCQQTYRNCKGENLAKAIEALAKYGVTTSLEIENLDKTVQNIMQTFAENSLRVTQPKSLPQKTNLLIQPTPLRPPSIRNCKTASKSVDKSSISLAQS